MKIFGPYKKRNKSASMQLSINAIVILVMAMAVLGLGLGLIRGVLGSGKDKLLGSLESMDLTEQATSEKPLTNINNIKVQRNKENTLGVGFYNADEPACATPGARLNITCNGLNWTQVTGLEVEVDQGEAKTVGAIFETGASAGNYACKVQVFCYDAGNEIDVLAESESAFIEVTA